MSRCHLFLTALALVVGGQAAGGQGYRAATIRVGRNFLSDSTAYTFDFAFNQPEADDPEAPHVLWMIRKAATHWDFAPTATASLGNGAQSAPDNLLLLSPFTGQFILNRGSGQATSGPLLLANVHLTPLGFSSNKDLTTALLYPGIGIEVYYRQWVPKRLDRPLRSWQCGLRLGVQLNAGRRFDRVADSAGGFLRVIPSTSIALHVEAAREGHCHGADVFHHDRPQILGRQDTVLVQSGAGPAVPGARIYEFPLSTRLDRQVRQRVHGTGL